MPEEEIPQDKFTVIARILRPQGRKGEVLAELRTDFPERFASRKSVFLRRPGQPQIPADIANHWLPLGKNAGRVVLHMAGSESINDAEALAGAEVVIPDEQRSELEDGSFYVSDLVGCMIVDEERELGVVIDVHFATDAQGKRVNDAAPVLVIENATGDELLIPMAKEYLHRPDVASKRIEVRLPPGLLEMNG